MNPNVMTWGSCILILVIFWLILIRPQKKKEKQIAAMRKGVKAGDKILTIGGMKARVIKDKEESLIIEVGEKVRMEVMRWAVSSVLEEGKGSVRKAPEKQIEEIRRWAQKLIELLNYALNHLDDTNFNADLAGNVAGFFRKVF